MNPDALTRWTHALPWPAIGIGAAVLALAITTWHHLRRALRTTERPPAAVLVAALSAAGCTAYSADTSWRFAEHRLGMTSATERGAMFAAAELALFSVALMARQNLRTTGAPGTPGLLVWVITGVQIIPAYAESGIVGGTVRAFVGPVLAALLWHLAMGIELRHAKPGANSQSLPAVIARELRERMLSRLGLTVRGLDAAQLTRDRWTVKAVGLAARLADFTPNKRAGLRGRFLAHRLSVAVGRAQAGANPQQRQMLLQLLAARRHATALATVVLPSPWEADNTDVRPALSAPDTPRGHALPAGAGHRPDIVSARVSATPDIVSAARADIGADTPVTSKNTDVRPRTPAPRTPPDTRADKTPDTGAADTDKPSVAALVRRALDNGIEDPDTVITEVRRIHPGADKDSVKRTLRREREKRTNYL